MRIIALFCLLAACKATPAEIDATRCDPATQLERCDDAGVRRMTCNAGNGQWTPFVLCQAPQTCLQLAPDLDGKQLTACANPDAVEDTTGIGADSLINWDVSAKDGQTVDTKNDAKVTDTAAADVDAGKVDVQVVSTLPQQTCFQNHCPTQTLVCLQTSTCIAAINAAMQCVTTCGGGQACMSQCQGTWTGNTAAYALAACGMLICAGGCGDGLCTGNETPTTCPGDCKAAQTGTCVGHCGGKSTDCYCDQPCVGKGDCCNDYAAACGG